MVSNARYDENDSLQYYLKDVSSTRLLSAQEEVALARQIKKGDMKARAKMVEANLRFVITVAKKYQNRGLPLVELISAGNIGLVTAVDRFDGDRGFKFISYAVWWIRQSIQQTLKEQSRMVRLPLNRIDLLHRIFQYVTQQQETSHRPDEDEIAKELGISVEMVKDTLVKGQRVLSLDATFEEDNTNTLMERITDETQEQPDVQLTRNSLHEDIEAVLHTLGDDRAQDIIKLYFGLDGAPGMTLEEIGVRYGVTRERIRQIKHKALCRLRNPVRARKLMSYTEEI